MSNDNTTNSFEELTFPSLLNKYDRILVPMIQRDYAQGRTDKKAQEVRTNILNDIFDKESVHFDLIFGSCEKRNENDGEKFCFVPVDGQQRLTTLFLLFLYAKKVKGLWNDLNLSKFNYDTRRAAADFCKKVATEEWNVSNGKVSDSIKDSVWFMNYWENDPTVAGMLNMLDDIHEKAKVKVFPDLDNVTFYFFDLESNGLNENLYLKMNSRGKPLTAFENLKASIEKELPEGEFAKNWKYNMDRDWTNAFWNSEKPEETDKNITAFIVRFLSGYWNAFMENREDDKIVADKLKDINGKDNYADFIPFEPIKTVLNYKKNKKKDAFIRLEAAFASVLNVEKIKPSWKENITSTNLSEYKIIAVVFAYVLFDGNTQAMRVAWNLAENTVSGYDNFIIYCRRIGEIYRYIEIEKIDIYHVLESNELKFNNPSAQMTEEIAKAKQIVNGGDEWETKIKEAEKKYFFKGAIRFLFTKENVGDDWGNFDTKWNNATKYFDENGVKEKTPYKTNALLMKSLLANCDNFLGKIWWHFEFSNDAIRWKRILTSNNWIAAVDAIMREEVTNETIEKCVKSITEHIKNTVDGSEEMKNLSYIKNIVDDGLMDYVCNKMSGAWIRSTYHGYHAIWIRGCPASQVVLNPILSKLQFEGKISYRNTEGRDSTIPNCRYYRCFDKNVDFKYKFNDKYYYFNWWGNPNETELDVYLTEDNWNDYKKRPNPLSDKGTDEDKYYCFRVTPDMVTPDMESNTSLFIEELDRLIDEASSK
ncbi:MAG: DUF262 domain-containing protein [Bacteroidales bacterium]|nr:DUF262 domain-containing protein [Bacteroidales bacterium]